MERPEKRRCMQRFVSTLCSHLKEVKEDAQKENTICGHRALGGNSNVLITKQVCVVTDYTEH